MAAWIVAGAALALGAPSPAEACEGHRGAAAGKVEKAEKAAKAEKAPAKHEGVVAEKCKCGNAADCTCKKGQCECKKCGSKRKVFDSLQDGAAPKELPARRDATAGVFI